DQLGRKAASHHQLDGLALQLGSRGSLSQRLSGLAGLQADPALHLSPRVLYARDGVCYIADHLRAEDADFCVSTLLNHTHTHTHTHTRTHTHTHTHTHTLRTTERE